MAKRWASHHDAYQPIYRFTIFIASLFDVCFTVPLPSSFIPSCPLLVETRSGGYTAGGKDDDLFQHNIAPPPPRSPQLDGKRFHGQNRVRILSNEYAYTVSVSARRRTINRGDVRSDRSASPSPYKHHRRRAVPPASFPFSCRHPRARDRRVICQGEANLPVDRATATYGHCSKAGRLICGYRRRLLARE